MSLPFDIDNYHKVFKKYPKCLMESSGRLYGWWYIGSYYKNPHSYYGEYPPSYMTRIRALFPNRKPALHIFGGMVDLSDAEFKVDINPKLKPSVCGNVQSLPFRNETFSLVCADPPYNAIEAQKYGYKLPNIRLVLREARRVTKTGGVLTWLDTKIPIYRKADWNLIGTIGLFTGTNRVVRVVSLFEAN